MPLADSLASLLDSCAYEHPCDAIELVETHLSWVLLTGTYAYKLKKPVKFPFVDFSSLELREHFCREEFRCNRFFASDLYLGVVAVTRQAGTGVSMGGDGEVVEWAVQMRQFDPGMQLDHLLGRGSLTPDMLAAFGRTLASQHAALPRLQGRLEEIGQRIFDPVADNFREIADTGLQAEHAQMLAAATEQAHTSGQTLRPLLEERMLDGNIRECHGDLHLSNLVLTDQGVTAFDCLEFNANLRWIDPICDVAFLFMDCHVRSRPDLAYAFVNAYLDASGDYRGARLLAYYAAYRSTVRAKVAALRWEQQPDAETAQRFYSHLRWGHDWQNRPPGVLVLMCGLSGSGKSQLAGRLLTQLPALRLRSDVARKVLAGLPAGARSNSPIDGGLNDTDQSDRVFSTLGEIAGSLLTTGENVIVDATFIALARRGEFLDIATRLGVKALVLLCEAPLEILRERVVKRAADNVDASEATLDVLHLQLDRFEAPTDVEPVIHVDTTKQITAAQIATLVEEILRD